MAANAILSISAEKSAAARSSMVVPRIALGSALAGRPFFEASSLGAIPFAHLLLAGGHIGASPSSPGECEAFGRRCAAAPLRYARSAVTATRRCGGSCFHDLC